ncbi:MAG: hypothetical protein ACRDRO_05600 [Pseudonocardiaceae bacterium]
MHEADDQGPRTGAARDLDGFRYGDELDEPARRTTGRSIRPRMAMSPTFLVTELDNGALIIQGRPDEPRVYLRPVDSMPLRRELAAAFGSAQGTLPHDQGEAR